MNKIKTVEKLGFAILTLLLFIGLIVRAYRHDLEPVFSGMFFKDVHIDLFSHGKAVFLVSLVGIGIFLALMILWERPQRLKDFNNIESYLLGTMIGLVVLSTVFSAYRVVALNGFMDRYEGMWVWMAYLLLPLMVKVFIYDSEKLNKYVQYFAVAVGLIYAVGALQYFGYDIIGYDWFRYLVFPLDQVKLYGPIKSGVTSVYATLYNQNFVGGFVALTLPLSWYAYSISESYFLKIATLLSAIGAVISLVGSYSRSGYIAFFLVCILYLARYIWVDRSFKLQSLLPQVICLVLIAGLFTFDLRAQNELIHNQVVAPESSQVSQIDQVVPRKILDIIPSQDSITIVTDKDSLKIALVDSALHVLNDQNEDLSLKSTEYSNAFVAADKRYEGYVFNIFADRSLLEVVVDNQQVPILMKEDGLALSGLDGTSIDASLAPSIGFKGNESFGSGRGYIWSRSLPLLKDVILIGHGADTFPLYFPQYDIGKFTIVNNFFLVIDKPHNSYIQMAMSFGVAFVLLYIALSLLGIFNLLKIFVLQKDSLALALAIPMIVFNIVGLVNDSVIQINPYMWIIYGLGFSYIALKSNLVIGSSRK